VTEFVTRLVRFEAFASRFVLMLAGALTALFFVLISAQVVSRYVFGISISSSDELSRYAFIWATILGAAAVTASSQNYEVRIIDFVIGDFGRQWLDSARILVQILVAGILLFWGARWALRFGAGTSPVMELSLGLIYAVVPVSGLYILFGLLLSLAQIWFPVRGGGR
jgi:TRAP-type transport system small permease protein